MDRENHERRPTRTDVDCAWCGLEFTSVVDLLAHVEESHLIEPAAAA